MHPGIRLRIVFLLFMLGISGIVPAQPEKTSIPANWKTLLKDRNDDSFTRLIAAGQGLLQQDKPSIFTTLDSLSLLKLSSNGRQRLDLLKAYIFHNLDNQQAEWIPSTLENILTDAYARENLESAAAILQLLSAYHASRFEYAQSVAYAQTSLDLMRQQPDYSLQKVAPMMFQLGNLYYWSFHNDSARVLLASVLHHFESIPQDSIDATMKLRIMEGYNTLGLCYEKLGQYESALASFDKGIQQADHIGHAFYRTLMEGNKGDVYFLQGRYDEAEPLLRTDYEQSIRNNELANAANSLQWLGRIQVIRGNAREGLALIRKADSLLTNEGFEEFHMRLYSSFQQAFTSLRMPDSAAYYQEKAQMHALQLERLKTKDQTTVVNLLLDQQKQLRQTLTLKEEKKRVELIRNFSLVLVLVLSIAGFLYINRLQLKAKHKQLQADMAIAAARHDLDQFTTMMRDKNQLIETLQGQLMHKEQDAIRIERIEELSQLTMLTSADWDRFKLLFTQVYPNFFTELTERVPDVTQAEMRMAALIRLRMSTREAAKLLGISENSVRKTRYRLRDRLGLQDEKDLFRFLHLDDEPEEINSDNYK
jgi:tetratricopeptide (TPR) repeat protein/DNA-binding CsgD family transcriptional regulator